ncbi:MAG: PEGA domain-containing protein [Verrucomicrobiales bacterium]|nr:PEGA domain-containing protein [Verrucomicrobiales bacterium]
MEPTKITLPPVKRVSQARSQGGGASFGFAAMGWVVAALLLGVLIGVLVSGRGEPQGGDLVDQASSQHRALAKPDEAAVVKLLAKARVEMATGDWLEARQLYLAVLGLDAQHLEAKTTLPLIEAHIDAAQGRVVVRTVPEGASVKLGKWGVKKSPAVFEKVPIGSYVVEVSMQGYDKIERTVAVRENDTVEIGALELSALAGSLSVSSVPKGVPFELLAEGGDANSKKPVLVQAGKTPVTLEKLPPGDYNVTLKMAGRPNFSEKIRIANNRQSSVSHVFVQGGLQLTSDPSGAEVWIKEYGAKGGRHGQQAGRRAGFTPLSIADLTVGKHELVIRYQDWPEIRRVVEIEQGEQKTLEFAWKRSLVSFVSDPPGAEVFLNDKTLGRGGEKTPMQVELPEGQYRWVARRDGLADVVVEQDLRVDGANKIEFNFEYGKVKIGSDPAGATVVLNGVPMGRTPFLQNVVRPGHYEYQLRKGNYRSAAVSGEVEPGQSLDFNVSLKYDPSPVLNQSFANSYGQKMQWVAPLKEWVGAYEVSQGFYQAVIGKNPSAFKGGNRPVESVSWYDAKRFCEKLTIDERSRGTLPKGFVYDLPSDREWSVLVGGAQLEDAVTSRLGQLEGTAEVGTSLANEYGLYDVRGNVWEWCDDWYSQTILKRSREVKSPSNPSWVGTERKVARGGSWSRSSGYDLATGYRLAVQPSKTDRYDLGFRVVLKRQ